MRTRLIDVAREVGVSAKTVSNVVHGTGMVSDAMRKKILETIDEMGYQPNLAARQLRTGTTGLLALALPDLRETFFAEFASYFFPKAREQKLSILVAQTQGQLDLEKDVIEGIGMPAFDGMVINPLKISKKDLEGRSAKTPIVLIGEHGRSLASTEYPHVGIDNVNAAYDATNFLLQRGRRKIAVVGVQQTNSSPATSRLRLLGVQKALKDAGLDLPNENLGQVTSFNRAEGAKATHQLLERGADFDALVCFNDSLAFGAVHALASNGIKLQEDVEVMGFDNLEEGSYLVLSFHSVDLNFNQQIDTILKLLKKKGKADKEFYTTDYSIVPAEKRKPAPLG